MLIRVCSTVVEPRYAPVGSKTDDTLIHYVVPSTVWNDPLCDCKGYIFRGYCRHITEVESDKCQWWTNQLDWHEPCPNCGSPVVDFEMDPEYE
jgi:hypothetical protein